MKIPNFPLEISNFKILKYTNKNPRLFRYWCRKPFKNIVYGINLPIKSFPSLQIYEVY